MGKFLSKSEPTFAQGVSLFSKKILKAVSSSSAEDKDENLICSPLSCLITLAVVQAGAKGRTLDDMTKALCMPKDLEETHQGFLELLNKLKLSSQAVAKNDTFHKFTTFDCSDHYQDKTLAISKVHLKFLNILKLKEDYLVNQEKIFNSNPLLTQLAVDLVNHTATADSINKWVETQTKNKAKNLFHQADPYDWNDYMLSTYVDFQCNWLNKFQASSTRPDTFYLNETKTVEVPFMYQKEDFPFADLPELDSKLIQLPYESGDSSFVIILPNEKTGLAALQSKLATKDLAKLLKQAKYAKVEVSLPKFKFASALNLNDSLKKMGFEDAFDEESADFSGMTDTKPIFIFDVIHEAFIEVNEEGTVSAIDTIAWPIEGAAPGQKEEIGELFKCDHPFAFFIVFKGEYTMFAGCLRSPPKDTEPPT